MRSYLVAGSWYVLVAGLLWGTTGTAQAFAPEGALPQAIGALRLAIASVALLPLAIARKALPSNARWPLLPTTIAAASVAAYQPFFFRAVAISGVAIGTVVAIGSAPIIAGMMGWVVRGESPSIRWALATALAVLGTAFLFAGDAEGPAALEGVALALGAGTAYAAYVIASKELLARHQPDAVIAVVFGLGALILVPLLFFVEVSWALTARGAVIVLYLGLVATALAYVLFVRGLKLLPAGPTVTLSLAEPLTAAALGVILLGEQLSTTAFLGAILLLAGLAIVGFRSTEAVPQNESEE